MHIFKQLAIRNLFRMSKHNFIQCRVNSNSISFFKRNLHILIHSAYYIVELIRKSIATNHASACLVIIPENKLQRFSFYAVDKCIYVPQEAASEKCYPLTVVMSFLFYKSRTISKSHNKINNYLLFWSETK